MKQLLLKEVFSAIDDKNNIKLSALLHSSPDLFTTKDEITGNTPLHYAVYRKSLLSIRCIFNAATECSVNNSIDLQISILTIENREKLVPIALADKNLNAEIKKIFFFESVLGQIIKEDVKLQFDASLWEKLTASSNLLEIKDDHGNTIFHHIVQTENKPAIKWFLKQTPQLLFNYNNNGDTPLALAARNQAHEEILRDCLHIVLAHIQIPDVDGKDELLAARQREEYETQAKLEAIKLQEKVILENPTLISTDNSFALNRQILKGKYGEEIKKLFDGEEEQNIKAQQFSNFIKDIYSFPPQTKNDIPNYAKIKIDLEQQLLNIDLEIKRRALEIKQEGNQRCIDSLLEVVCQYQHRENNNNYDSNNNNNNNIFFLPAKYLTKTVILADILIVKLLLAAGIAYNVTDEQGKKLSTYLFEHKLASSEQAAILMLTSWAPKSSQESLTIIDEHQNTLLHWIIEQEQVQTLEALLTLDLKLPVLERNQDNLTALQLARIKNQPQLFKLLLRPTVKEYFSAKQQQTELAALSRKDIDEQVEILSNLVWHFSGLEKNIVQWPFLNNQLDKHFLVILKDFFKWIDIDIKEAKDASGHTLLHWASATRQKEAVNWFLEADQGLDPLVQNATGQTPLHLTIIKSPYVNNVVLESLEKAVLNSTSHVVDEVESRNSTSFAAANAFDAIMNCDVEKLKISLDEGVSVNAKKIDGHTLLQAALQRIDGAWKDSPDQELKTKALQCLIALLERGANVTHKTEFTQITEQSLLLQLLEVYRYQNGLMNAAKNGDYDWLHNSHAGYTDALDRFDLSHAISAELIFLKNFIENKRKAPIQDVLGNTPLHYLVQAAMRLNEKLAQALAGYRESIIYWLDVNNMDLYIKNSQQRTPLQLVLLNSSHSLWQFFHLQLQCQNIIAAIKQNNVNVMDLTWSQLPDHLKEYYRTDTTTHSGFSLVYYAFLYRHYNIAADLLTEIKCTNILSKIKKGPYQGKTIFSLAAPAGSHFVSLLLNSRNCLILKALHKLDVSTLKELLYGGSELHEPNANDISPFQTLDLSGESLEEKQFIMLAQSLKNNTHIKVLRLHWNNSLSDFALLSLSEMLKHNKTLEEIDLSGNEIDTSKLSILLDGWKQNLESPLKVFHLKHNRLTEKSVDLLRVAIQQRPQLSMISLEGNSEISWQAQEKLIEELTSPANLQAHNEAFIFPLNLPDEFAELINQLRRWLIRHPAYQIALKHQHLMTNTVPQTRADALLVLLKKFRTLVDRAEKTYSSLMKNNNNNNNGALNKDNRWQQMMKKSVTAPNSPLKYQYLAKFEALYQLVEGLEAFFQKSSFVKHYALLQETWIWQFYVRTRQTQVHWLTNLNKLRDPQYQLLLDDPNQLPYTLEVFERSFKYWMKVMHHGYEQWMQNVIQKTNVEKWMENAIQKANIKQSALQFFQKLGIHDNNLLSYLLMRVSTFSSLTTAHQDMSELVKRLQGLTEVNSFYQALGNNLGVLSEKKGFGLMAKMITHAYRYPLSLLSATMQDEALTPIQQMAFYMVCHVGYWLAAEKMQLDTVEQLNDTLTSMVQWLRFVPWLYDVDVQTRAGNKYPASQFIRKSGWQCTNNVGASNIYNISYASGQANQYVYTDSLQFGAAQIGAKEVERLNEVLNPELSDENDDVEQEQNRTSVAHINHQSSSVAEILISRQSLNENKEAAVLEELPLDIHNVALEMDKSIINRVLRQQSNNAQEVTSKQKENYEKQLQKLETQFKNEKESSRQKLIKLEADLKLEQDRREKEEQQYQADRQKDQKEVQRLERIIQEKEKNDLQKFEKQQKKSEELEKSNKALQTEFAEFKHLSEEKDKTHRNEMDEMNAKIKEKQDNFEQDVENAVIRTLEHIKNKEKADLTPYNLSDHVRSGNHSVFQAASSPAPLNNNNNQQSQNSDATSEQDEPNEFLGFEKINLNQ